MDFATVAIFFSSITATTLQFSYQTADNTISSTIVNLCWFASLVLSIASATNSLLGVLVHQSPEYLRPSRNMNSSFLQNWFKYIPPTLLTISGALFLIGFCSFTYLSTSSFKSQVRSLQKFCVVRAHLTNAQGRAIQTVTSSLTCTNFFALLSIFLLAFTKVLHRLFLNTSVHLFVSSLMLSACFTARWAVVLTACLLVLVALPFTTLYCLICFQRFPLNFDEVFWFGQVFERPLWFLDGALAENQDRVEEIFLSRWRELKEFFSTKFGRHWARIKAFVRKLSPRARP